MKIRIFPISTAITLLPSTSFAAEKFEGGGWGDLLRMFGGLGLVLGLLYLCYALAKKYGGALPGGRGGVLKVVEVRHLGPKKALALVEVRGEELLIGIGADRLDLLHRLEKRPGSNFEGELQSRMESRP